MARNNKKKTTEQFKKEMSNIVGEEYEVLGEYKNANTKVKIRHNICGIEYEVSPSSFLNNGRRCKVCSIKNKRIWNKKSDSFFRHQVYELVGDEYEILGEYKNEKTKILIKHNECGNTFEMTPSGFLAGHRCHTCNGGIKKTYDKFVVEFYQLAKDEYTLLSNYVNNSTKVLIRHNTCNHEWRVQPSSFLQGTRCPKCAGKMKKTTEQFKKEVFEQVKNEYTVLGEYVNANTKIFMKHNVCDHEYEVTPSKFINTGRRCPNCNKKKKKTNEQFLEEIINLVGNEYEALDEYKNATTKILIRHNTCGYEWKTTPSNFTKGKRCPSCAGNARKTTEIFKKEVHDLIYDEYDVLGEYMNIDTPIQMKHNSCGNEFSMSPYGFLHGSRCPKCVIENTARLRTKTTEQFGKEVKELTNSEYELVGEYINCREKVKLKHNLCGSIYEQSPSDFLSGCRCSICFESKGEQAIRHWLEDNKINFTPQYEYHDLFGIGGGLLRYDFYLPDNNLLIEYQGEFHDGHGGGYTTLNLDKQQEHDRRKKEYAKHNNIDLLEIWYWDFDNIEKILEKELSELVQKIIG